MKSRFAYDSTKQSAPASLVPGPVKSTYSLLLLFLLLFALLLLDNPPRDTQAIVFLKVIVNVHVPANEQVWVRLLELVIEGVVLGNRHLVDIQVDKLGAVLQNLLNTEVANLLALAQLNVLQVWHCLDNVGKSGVADCGATQFQCVAVLQAWFDGLVHVGHCLAGDEASAFVIDAVAADHVEVLQVPALAKHVKEAAAETLLVIQGSFEVEQGVFKRMQELLDTRARDTVDSVDDQGVERVGLASEVSQASVSNLLAVGDVQKVQLAELCDVAHHIICDSICAA